MTMPADCRQQWWQGTLGAWCWDGWSTKRITSQPPGMFFFVCFKKKLLTIISATPSLRAPLSHYSVNISGNQQWALTPGARGVQDTMHLEPRYFFCSHSTNYNLDCTPMMRKMPSPPLHPPAYTKNMPLYQPQSTTTSQWKPRDVTLTSLGPHCHLRYVFF